jgi:hypothetical protein
MAEKNMQVFLKKLNRPLLATWIVLVFFLISLSGILFPSLETWSSHVANRNYNGEGLIEIIEAVCWLSSCILGSPEQLFSSRSQARLMLCDNKSATMATARCVANSDI